MLIKINSGNLNKINEYKQYLEVSGHKIETTEIDLKEPVSNHETITCYKASQFSDEILVDDVSLDIEGFDIGVNVRWFLEKGEFHKEKYWNRKSSFKCCIGVNKNNTIYIYKGVVEGIITSPRGNEFGIAPFFLPNGATKTLGEEMPPELNPRYLALKNFLNDQWSLKLEPIKQWDGEFQ